MSTGGTAMAGQAALDPVVQAIRTQGYAVIPGVLSPGIVADLVAASDRLQAADAERFGQEFLHRIGQTGFIINVGDRDPAFTRLLSERPAQPVVDAVLGQDAFLYLFQGVIVPPGGGMGAFPWKWHCDLFHVTQDVGDRSFVPGLNCLFYLDDVNAENGATWVLPATQGLPDSDVPVADVGYTSQTAVQVTAKAGSMIIFNPLLWHCAGHNRTDRPRRAVKMLFVRSWMMPQMDYPRSIRPEILQCLDEQGRRIVGCDTRVPRSFEELVASWRSGSARDDSLGQTDRTVSA
jgi:ectoine hydroxylase-related dioxygenase (phytanoyl-CoA dioxygenase family)